MSGIQKSKISQLIKECLLDLLKNDSDVIQLLSESVRKPLPPKPHIDYSNPVQADLFDKLLLVAEGKIPKVSSNGKVIMAPNKGIGWRSAERIKEWSSKAYSQLGGKWNDKSSNINESFQRNGSDIDEINPFIADLVRGIELEGEGGKPVEMKSLFEDTARTTFKEQLGPERQISKMNQMVSSYGGMMSESEVFQSPSNNVDTSFKQIYGEKTEEIAGNWEFLAFGNKK